MEFQNGKIYTIRSHQTNKYYIGSTNQKTLSQRLGKHRCGYKKYLTNNNNKYTSSFEILQYTDHYIELLELYPCNTNDELHRREGELIRQYRSDVVNIQMAGRTQKEYRVDNIQVISEQMKQYKLNNKEKIVEQNKQTIICECGSTINKHEKPRHIKTPKHINLIQQLFNNELNHYTF